ncbi:hypothetical protein RRF57_012797 [Xylaria bambusicola]|uniref:NWD NACHT-NTPase N-terminal domain-containing protein n=1 Tax=Xylaria bambusicola TaxID=326684 RepID=A0AAN7Z4T8_9PEZI
MGLRRQLKNFLNKKGTQKGDSNHTEKTQSEAINHEDPPGAQSFWDRAYDALRSYDSKLVDDYEELLTKEAQKGVLPDTASNYADRQSQQAQLEAVIAAGLQRADEKKTKYTIAGHEFNLSNQIDQAARLVLWAKGWIGEAVKQSPEASIVWAGVSIILPLLTNPVVADEANRDGFTYVTTRMQYYTAFEPLLLHLGKNSEATPALMMEANKHVIQLYQHILEFQLKSVLRFYKGRVRRYVSDVIQTEDWKEMVDNINQFEGAVDRTLMQINQFAVRQELESCNTRSAESLEVMRQLLSVSEDQVRVAKEQLGIAQRSLQIQEDKVQQKFSDRQSKCLQLFRLTDSSEDATYEWYKDLVESRVDGTCEWFLKHENYQKWLKQDSGPLFVSADPGCGKSVLAKHLIDFALPRSSTICYFFFKDQAQNTCRQALCALLHQLLLLKPHLIKHAMKQFDIDGGGLVNSTSSLWTILRNAVQDPQAGHIIIVLDALDECSEGEFENLMRNLETLFHDNQSSPCQLKYLLTSRPYEQIVSKFRYFLDKFPCVRIPGEEESETISQEVNQVIKYRVEKLAKGKNLSDPIKNHLAKRLLEISHRTYLWVYLVFDSLEKEDFKKTQKGVDAAVAMLPKDINQAYEKILSKCKGDKVIVRKALSIILAASRPLTLVEMNVALEMDYTYKSIHDLDLEEEADFKSRLRSWCGLFISIHHGRVYFLHQTAREFLLGITSPIAHPFRGQWQNLISLRDAHRVLAETCIMYLDLLNSDDVIAEKYQDVDPQIVIYTFFPYSARNWNAHFLEAGFSDHADIIPRALRICDPHFKSCNLWLGMDWPAIFMTRPAPPNSLMVSSFCGNGVVARLLLEEDAADLDSTDSIYGRTPLLWAARDGHLDIVQILLDRGANIDMDDNEGYSPLSWAAENGHVEVTKLLLDKGADMESVAHNGTTALSLAAAYGNAEVVKLLIERGTNLEYMGTASRRTPLSWAAANGDGNIVKMLLDKGANTESRDAQLDRTPLLWAAELGHKEAVNSCSNTALTWNSKLPLVILQCLWQLKGAINELSSCCTKRGLNTAKVCRKESPDLPPYPRFAFIILLMSDLWLQSLLGLHHLSRISFTI